MKVSEIFGIDEFMYNNITSFNQLIDSFHIYLYLNKKFQLHVRSKQIQISMKECIKHDTFQTCFKCYKTINRVGMNRIESNQNRSINIESNQPLTIEYNVYIRTRQ